MQCANGARWRCRLGNQFHNFTHGTPPRILICATDDPSFFIAKVPDGDQAESTEGKKRPDVFTTGLFYGSLFRPAWYEREIVGFGDGDNEPTLARTQWKWEKNNSPVPHIDLNHLSHFLSIHHLAHMRIAIRRVYSFSPRCSVVITITPSHLSAGPQ
jgi:hypothetical protein